MNKIFTLYYKNKVKVMYIEELPEEKNYYIHVYGDDIENFLEQSTLPEAMKQKMREDVVAIVRNYNKFVIGKSYNEETRLELYDFFRTQLSRFVINQGIFYSFKEEN